MAGADPGTPAEVERLIALALPTMVHIELLLLLHRTAPAAWSAEGAAVEIRNSLPLVAPALADLEAAHLAARMTGAAGPEWRLDPGDDRLLAATAELREMYDRRPVTLVKALYRRPPSAAEAFADAFRLRPKGDR